jgi:hypothetical protein
VKYKSDVGRRCTAFLLLKLPPRFVCFCLGISSPWVKLVRISNSPSLFTFAANSWGMLKDLKLPSRFLMKHRFVCWKFSLQIILPKVTNPTLDFSGRDCVFNIVIGLLDAVLALCLHGPILIQTTFASLFLLYSRCLIDWTPFYCEDEGSEKHRNLISRTYFRRCLITRAIVIAPTLLVHQERWYQGRKRFW